MEDSDEVPDDKPPSYLSCRPDSRYTEWLSSKSSQSAPNRPSFDCIWCRRILGLHGIHEHLGRNFQRELWGHIGLRPWMHNGSLHWT